VAVTLTGASNPSFTSRNKAFFADEKLVSFVRPGLMIAIDSAQIASDGTISAVFRITDPSGVPLDREGIITPGPVSTSFVAAHIPANETQYVAYTTRSASGAAVASTQQASSDSGGAYTRLADGQYRYTFATRAPSGFPASATHTIGIYGNRNLSEFDLGTNYASTTFNFVPNGSVVTTVRDVIRTSSCNKCHDQLSSHGGSRRGIEMCDLCHTPQTLDPDTGHTLDMKVMIHKIHMGSELPSVQAGTPYRIIGNQGSVSDWSTVVHPSDPRRCESCHEQNSGATQATRYLTSPTRASCGSCHDDVNFATGQNHAGGPQVSDNQCSICHIPQGELEFDASIKGSHLVPEDSTSLHGLALDILRVDNGTAGRQPTVTFTVKDKAGAAVPLSQLNNLSLVMAGPTWDYGYTSFGPDVTTPGFVSESATGAQCNTGGTCMYTFQHAIPSDAAGSFAVGIESRRTETLLPGTTTQMDVRYGGANKVFYFSVDGSAVQPRRTVVQTASCNRCHASVSAHGSNRNQVEMCVLCHNPSLTDADDRSQADDPNERNKPPQGVNFNLLIHRIHTGKNLKDAGKGYTVIGFGGSTNDFTDVRYPAMTPQGGPGDTRHCAMCHVSDSQTMPAAIRDVLDPQGFINPVKPVSSSCIGCHVTAPASSHALTNTNEIGESCGICHGPNRTSAVDEVHAQY
jgi:OmcA/MtrC family decaheme c-type cytochrome